MDDETKIEAIKEILFERPNVLDQEWTQQAKEVIDHVKTYRAARRRIDLILWPSEKKPTAAEESADRYLKDIHMAEINLFYHLDLLAQIEKQMEREK